MFVILFAVIIVIFIVVLLLLLIIILILIIAPRKVFHKFGVEGGAVDVVVAATLGGILRKNSVSVIYYIDVVVVAIANIGNTIPRLSCCR